MTKTYAIKNSWTMKAEDTISTLHRLREGNGEALVERGREEDRTEESLVSEYFMLMSIERNRRLLDERRVKWIARRMDMIAKETKETLGMGVGYRVDMEAVEKVPTTQSLEEKEEMLGLERYSIELLLVWEVRQWEQLFRDKFNFFLDQIGNDRVAEKERLTREWRASCWKRLNTQMHAAMKRMADVDDFYKDSRLKSLGEQWALSISYLFEGLIIQI